LREPATLVFCYGDYGFLNNMDTETLIIENKKKPALIAQYIQNELPPIIKSNNILYIYNKKYYNELCNSDIKDIIYKFLKKYKIIEYFKTSYINDVIGAIEHNDETPKKKIDNYDNLINLNNGIYNLDTFELIEHSKDYYFSYIIDAEYKENEKIEIPYFQNFLNKLFTINNNEPDIKEISNIIRLGGYLLYPKNMIDIMFIFLGEGANGKSVLIDIFSLFFAKEFLTSLNLRQLSNPESFSREPLSYSKINITTEEKGGKIDSEEIKKITSGDDITIIRKYKKAITFKPSIKLIIASNSTPHFNDTTHAIYRRLMIFDFQNRFIENDEEYNKIKNPNKKRIFKASNKIDLLENIKKEKNSILKLFLNGLKDLRSKKWQFPKTKNQTEIMNEYKDISDKLGTFIKENYEEIENYDIEKASNDNIKDNCLSINTILQEYKIWYKENISETKFFDNTKTIGKKIKYIFRINNKRIKIFNEIMQESKVIYYPLKKII